MKKLVLVLALSVMLFSCNESGGSSSDGGYAGGGNSGGNGGGNQNEHVINGKEYVDLGLPSGLKWAKHNVGANSSTGFGNYYAWGEVTTKSYYDYDNCSTYGEDINDISGKIKYDVARKDWGATWRIPTKNEMKELIDECAWEWINANDVYGYKITGPSGAFIFLPAAGDKEEYEYSNVGEGGCYWLSTPNNVNDYGYYSYSLEFDEYDYENASKVRYRGFTIRPVSE